MSEETNGMKIFRFKVDGIRKLKAVEMEFSEDGLTIVKGANEEGKSTLWNALEWLVEGNKHLNKDIIGHDRDSASGELYVGDYVIKRSTNRKGNNKLEVKNLKTGIKREGEVQRFLDTLVNTLTFDPRPLNRKNATEKYEFFMKLFKEQMDKLSQEVLGYNFAQIATKLTELEDKRLKVGQEIKQFGDLDKDAPTKVDPVDTTELFSKKKEIEATNKQKRDQYDIDKQKEIEGINEFNKIQRDRQERIKTSQNLIDEQTKEISNIDKEIDDLEKQLASKKSLREITVRAKIDLENAHLRLPNPEPEKPLTPTIETPKEESVEELELQIQNATAINQKAELYTKHQNKRKEKVEKQNKYTEYNDEINEIRRKKLDVLRKVNTGVPGLEIREDGIYHNDIYCDNWSGSEGIKIHCELASANLPAIRAILIDDGENLDKKSRQYLHEFGKRNNIQYGISIVADEPTKEDKENDNVFWIEDGTITKLKE